MRYIGDMKTPHIVCLSIGGSLILVAIALGLAWGCNEMFSSAAQERRDKDRIELQQKEQILRQEQTLSNAFKIKRAEAMKENIRLWRELKTQKAAVTQALRKSEIQSKKVYVSPALNRQLFPGKWWEAHYNFITELRQLDVYFVLNNETTHDVNVIFVKVEALGRDDEILMSYFSTINMVEETGYSFRPGDTLKRCLRADSSEISETMEKQIRSVKLTLIDFN